MRRCGFGQQLVAIAEDGRLGGTGFRARRLLSGADAVVAENALADVGNRGLPLVARNAIRAGHHAIAAAHAFGAVVNHGAKIRLVQRPDRAGRGAGRFQAVAALLAHKCLFGGLPGPRSSSWPRARHRHPSGAARQPARWFCFLQAATHSWQPMHLVVSVRIAAFIMRGPHYGSRLTATLLSPFLAVGRGGLSWRGGAQTRLGNHVGRSA